MISNYLQRLAEEEVKMVASDKLVIETAERKNAVESYIYNMRNKMNNTLQSFATPTDKTNFLKLLEDTETWLYGDGAEQTKSAYSKKYDEMKAVGDLFVRRHLESENRYECEISLRSTIDQLKLSATSDVFICYLIILIFQDPKYDHIEKAEKDKVVKECNDALKWLDDLMRKQESVPKTSDPIVLCSDLTKKRAV